LIAASALGLALVAGGVVALGEGTAQTRPPVPTAGASSSRFAVAPEVSLRPREQGTGAAAAGRREPTRGPRHPAAGIPVRVVIGALGVDVPVVGIDAPGGVLTPPDDPQVLGWWRSGARPGAAVGSALVTGHTVSTGGGALDDLETLTRGQRVLVRTRQGTVPYAVTGVRIFAKSTLARAAARVFDQSAPGRLVLITCEDWNGTAYESNVVVTARPTR
jgi:hypothetical protein